jgi:hypothetical protein
LCKDSSKCSGCVFSTEPDAEKLYALEPVI